MKAKIFSFILNLLLVSILPAQYSLDNLVSSAQLPYLKSSVFKQISSYDTTGGNNDRITLLPGQKATLANIQGPGVITRIWVTIDSRDPYFLRRMVLRMFWDEEATPSVEVPIGDFFGTGFQYKHYFSQFVGMTSGGYFSYFPMPFQKSARIEVENETGQEVYAFYYHIDYQQLLKPLEQDVAYFHAFWKRDIRTVPGQNYLILEAEGTGHFIGVNMSMQGYNRNLWFLEGDEMVYVDGEEFPSMYGTGTEDYFTSGWYFNRGEFYSPSHGLIIKNDSLARIAAYRFQIGDAIPFKKSLKFTIEHGHANTEMADYSSTAYWYQKEPHRTFPPFLKASLRIPLRVAVPEGIVEGESLIPVGKNIQYQIEDMSDFGADWSGFQQLKVIPAGRGSDFTLTIPQAGEERFNVHLFFTKGPSYGDWEIYYNNQKVGQLACYAKETIPGGKIVLSDLRIINEKLELKFIAATKHPRSSSYQLGIDALLLEPVRKYIPEWYIIGPFPNQRKSEEERLGLDTVYPPEQEIDFNKTYLGADSQQVKWQLFKTPANGRFQLWDKIDPYELVVVYALTFVYSPIDQTLPLMIGSDDGVKVILNDQTIHRKLLVRISEPDQDIVPVPLKKGWNKLLLKIENNFGGYAFFARIKDLNNTLIFSPTKKK